MKVHELKCWPAYFQAVLDGSKPFEVRIDDRGFSSGDQLLLREWDPNTRTYSGRKLLRRVTYILRGGVGFGLPDHVVIMGIGTDDAKEIARWLRVTPRACGKLLTIEMSHWIALLAEAVELGEWRA